MNPPIRWTKRFHALVELEEWGSIKYGVYTQATPEKGKEAKKWVIMNLSDEAIGPVEISRSVPEFLEKLLP